MQNCIQHLQNTHPFHEHMYYLPKRSLYKELKNRPYQISQIVNRIWYTHHNRIKLQTKNTTRKSTNVGTQMYLKIAMAKKKKYSGNYTFE